MTEEENMQLMQTLDDAWNDQDWETFRKRHHRDVAVHWPGGAPPTKGRDAHHAECVAFFKTFPDNRLVNRPYKIFFAKGDFTCSIADFTGTMKGPMTVRPGTTIPATNQSFHLEFCTVATWKRGEIVEERLFYDAPGLMAQLGLG